MMTTKRFALALISLFTILSASAQNNNVGIGTTTPDASAILELKSTTQGFLPPRMTEAQRDLMPVSPATTVAEGLVIYCTDCVPNGILQVYNGTAWTDMCGGTIGPPLTVQQRLDAGETSILIYNSLVADGATSSAALDSLYGKTYQGGKIAYLDIVNGTGLIAAPSDQSPGMEWTFSPYHLIYIGAIAQFTTLGNTNTVSIVGQAGVPASGINYAAYLCDTLTLGGYTDWYLPSKDELNYLWENLADSDGDNSNTGPTDPNNLGGFANNFYWSSTERDAITAWGQLFTIGYQSRSDKIFPPSYVRAVRAF